jgi:asparagine synthase (glutamine-hydrolysing)
MFAFALWDEKKKRLLLGRDRLGKKPMYYSIQNGTIYFGSELSAVLTALPNKPEINLEAIDLYLSLQYIPDPLTAYEGIFKLPPAQTLVWENGQAPISVIGITAISKFTAQRQQKNCALVCARLSRCVC